MGIWPRKSVRNFGDHIRLDRRLKGFAAGFGYYGRGMRFRFVHSIFISNLYIYLLHCRVAGVRILLLFTQVHNLLCANSYGVH